MTSPGDSPAAARWQRLVSGRLEELGRLAPATGSVRALWDRRAERCPASAPVADAADPFLRRLRSVTDASSTLVDVGAGAGRHALEVAAVARHVTAVEPSAAMLAVLRRYAAQRAITNLTTVQASWDAADVAPVDIAYSSYVLTLVPDAPDFLAKLEAVARRHVLLYLGDYSGDAALDPLWRHFHDVPRAPGATYDDAVAVLRELGIEPAVEVVEVANDRRFATIEEAAEHYREWLFLDDEPAVMRELEGLLRSWLLGQDGAFRSPLGSVPAAIVQWRPRS